jgi:hypothetical protein
MKETVEAAILRRKQEAFAQIRRDLRDGLRKNQLEDRAKATPPLKLKVKATVLDFPPKRAGQEQKAADRRLSLGTGARTAASPL